LPDKLSGIFLKARLDGPNHVEMADQIAVCAQRVLSLSARAKQNEGQLADGRTIGVKVSRLAHAEGSTDPHAGAGRINRFGEDARSFHSEDAALKLASIRNSLRLIESSATTPAPRTE
jgi:hypothetical protein